MANRDWSGLDWGTAASLIPMGRASWDPDMDVGKVARGNFDTQANAALLASLSGNAANPLDYLASQGYSVGVGHEPGTSPGGRPEYWGLIDPQGSFVQGQTDPAMTLSDTMMDNITPFLMMLPAVAGIAAAGAGAAGGGVGAAAGGSGGVGSLGAAADGLTALGSSWSPQALGLTGGIAPGVTSAELAALSSSLPSLAPSITDLAIQGAMRGAVTGGVKGLVSGQNPLESALQGAIGGGLTGGIGGGVNAINPGGAGWINSGITGGITSAIGGGNPLAGAIGGAAGPLASSAMSSINQPTAGGSMDFGNLFSDWSPDNLNTDLTGLTGFGFTSDLPTFSGGGLWNPEFSDWASVLSGGGEGGGTSTWLDTLKGWLAPVADGSGGTKPNPVGMGLATLLGTGFGAASGGKTETSTRQTVMDPRFDPFVFGSGIDDDTAILGHARNLWLSNPSGINPTMQQGLDMQRAALTDPAYGQSYQQMRNLGTSLMGGGVAANPFSTGQASLGQPAGLLAQQPTAQAGGVGGLLGGSNEDRAKALIAAGRGLLG